jgi:hypothetical protein
MRRYTKLMQKRQRVTPLGGAARWESSEITGLSILKMKTAVGFLAELEKKR